MASCYGALAGLAVAPPLAAVGSYMEWCAAQPDSFCCRGGSGAFFLGEVHFVQTGQGALMRAAAAVAGGRRQRGSAAARPANGAGAVRRLAARRVG